MSPRRAAAVAALLAAAGAAYGFVRETTSNGDPASGRCLWWGKRQVGFKVNMTSAASPPGGRAACPTCAPSQDAAAAAALVASAVPTWSGATRAGEGTACTDFTFTSDGTTTLTTLGQDGVNLVVARTGLCGSVSVVPQTDACRATVGACAEKYNCWEHGPSGVIGITTTSYDAATGEITDADIEMYGWDGKLPASGYYLTCAASPSCSSTPWVSVETNCASVDVASLALHESGHVLGLDHTCQYPAPYDGCPAASVMQPIIPTGTTRRTLAADDVAGVCTIYPRAAATLTCAPSGDGSGGGKSGGCACGGDAAGGIALAASVLALLRARRRRG